MKLLVKPLKGGEFELDNVELSNTVQQIKEMIAETKGKEEFPVESQKLIHGGKIMKDDMTLADYKVKTEGGFIVCMVSKKRAPPKKAEPLQAQETTNTASSTTAQTTSTTTTTPTTTQASQGGTASASPVIRDQDVENLVSMGFVESDVRGALQIARGNVAAATELLLNPELLTQAQTAQNEPPLDRFRRHPQINQLRAMVQQNPQALQTIITQIAQADPELHAAIQADQERFVQILNEPIPQGAAATGAGAGGVAPVPGAGAAPTPEQLQQLLGAMAQMTPEARAQFAQQMGMNVEQLQQVTELMQHMPPEVLQRMMNDMASGGGPFGGMGGAAGVAGAGAGTAGGGMGNVIQLTEDENQSINRLVELGFSRNACIQAYIACDRDENAAANLLFNTPFDEDEQQQQQEGTDNNNATNNNNDSSS